MLGRQWKADHTKLNSFHCFSRHFAGIAVFFIKGDGNSLTLLLGLTSGPSRSCCFAHFQLKTGTVALQVAALLGYHFPYSGSVLKDVIVLACTHLAQETESKRGDSGSVCLLESYSTLWCFLVSEEIQLMSGRLQAKASLGWMEATIHGHSQPSRGKYSSGKYYWILDPLFFSWSTF